MTLHFFAWEYDVSWDSALYLQISKLWESECLRHRLEVLYCNWCNEELANSLTWCNYLISLMIYYSKVHCFLLFCKTRVVVMSKKKTELWIQRSRVRYPIEVIGCMCHVPSNSYAHPSPFDKCNVPRTLYCYHYTHGVGGGVTLHKLTKAIIRIMNIRRTPKKA